MALRLIINGCAGRMGQMLLKAAGGHAGIRLVGGLEHKGHAAIGTTIRNFGIDSDAPISANAADFVGRADGVIDFTTPASTMQIAKTCQTHGWLMVCGTTGFAPAQWTRLRAAGKKLRVFHANNMSTTIHHLAQLVENTARHLADWDIEIIEEHHNDKRDAPSGTALWLGEAAARGRGKPLAKLAQYGRGRRSAERKTGSIGFHAVRAGTLTGTHEIVFAHKGESLRFSHTAEGRAVFANGAFAAALWLTKQRAGFYTMADMLR